MKQIPEQLPQRPLPTPGTPHVQSLYANIPATLEEELFLTLAQSGSTRIERIVSEGQATPPGEWYDQGWDEWVLLVAGEALLLFEEPATTLTLKPGDHIMIPAGTRHRVEWTDATQKTIWLAVHCDATRAIYSGATT
jgi:cupin 2 domain-containing protein